MVARPLNRWKLLLVAALASTAAVAVAVPAIGQSLLLLSLTPLNVPIAAIVGVAGALLVEVTRRAVDATSDRSRRNVQAAQVANFREQEPQPTAVVKVQVLGTGIELPATSAALTRAV